MPRRRIKPTLEQVRRKRVLQQIDLAKLAGVNTSTISRIEHGHKPSMATIRKLASVLGMEPAEIAWPGDPLGLAV